MSKISLFLAVCATVTVVKGRPLDLSIGVDKYGLTPPAALFNNALIRTYPHIGNTSEDADASPKADMARAYTLRGHLLGAAYGVADERNLPHIQNEKYYAMAASTVKLCSKLNAMEKCFDILTDSSLETANFERDGGWRMAFSKRFEYYTNAIETKIGNDPELSAIYKQIKANLPVMKFMDVYDILEDLTALREVGRKGMKFMLYKMHVHHSYGNISTAYKKEYYVTASSVFELAKKSNKLEPMQVLYDQVISEVVNLVDQDDFDVTVALGAPSIFYAKLEEKITSSPELKDDYEIIKQAVENSSKWPTKSFNAAAGSYPWK